jgi:hypothetical protein
MNDVQRDDCYAIVEHKHVLFCFYATDDHAAIQEAHVMGWQPENVRALRDGKWCEVVL